MNIARTIAVSFLSLLFFAGPSLVLQPVLSSTPQVLAASPIEDGLKKVEDQFPGNGKIAGSRSVSDLIKNVIYILLSVTLVIAVLFLIIGGYQYITSAGNEKQAESGKQTVVNALIGIVIIIMSYTIVRVIDNTLSR